jgi:hypothetical protein
MIGWRVEVFDRETGITEADHEILWPLSVILGEPIIAEFYTQEFGSWPITSLRFSAIYTRLR